MAWPTSPEFKPRQKKNQLTKFIHQPLPTPNSEMSFEAIPDILKNAAYERT